MSTLNQECNICYFKLQKMCYSLMVLYRGIIHILVPIVIILCDRDNSFITIKKNNTIHHYNEEGLSYNKVFYTYVLIQYLISGMSELFFCCKYEKRNDLINTAGFILYSILISFFNYSMIDNIDDDDDYPYLYSLRNFFLIMILLEIFSVMLCLYVYMFYFCRVCMRPMRVIPMYNEMENV